MIKNRVFQISRKRFFNYSYNSNNYNNKNCKTFTLVVINKKINLANQEIKIISKKKIVN